MEKRLITHSKYPLKFDYYATDDGRIWSEKSQHFMAQHNDKNGYKKVRLSTTDVAPGKTHTFSVHRLVLENFCPIEGMEFLQVNHKDGNKNNNRLENLEWMTCQENINHAIENHLRAEINGAAKLTQEQVIDIYKRSHSGESNTALGKEYGLHPDSIGRIRNKKLWKDLLDSIEGTLND